MCVCRLISGGQGRAQAAAVGESERGQFFSLPPRETSAGRGSNEPETGCEERREGQEERSGEGTRTGHYPAPPPTPTYRIHTHAHTLHSISLLLLPHPS